MKLLDNVAAFRSHQSRSLSLHWEDHRRICLVSTFPSGLSTFYCMLYLLFDHLLSILIFFLMLWLISSVLCCLTAPCLDHGWLLSCFLALFVLRYLYFFLVELSIWFFLSRDSSLFNDILFPFYFSSTINSLFEFLSILIYVLIMIFLLFQNCNDSAVIYEWWCMCCLLFPCFQ